MGFDFSKSSKPSTVAYRYGQMPAPKAWHRRRIGWFGHSLTLAMFMVLIGMSWTAHDVILHSLKENASQAQIPQPLNPSTLTAGSTLMPATNIVNLQPVLDAWAKDHPKQQWGIVVKSLDGPAFDARIQPNQQFEAASVYKLFLTLPLFDKVPVERQLSTMITVGGAQRSIADCVDLMLKASDNACGEAIGAYLNWKKVDTAVKKAGYTKTDFASSKNSVRTSAADAANFLVAMENGLFNRPATQTIMHNLLGQKYRSGIPAGCPGCTVANKTGDANNVVHDAGIVTYSKGKYVLVVMSRDGSFKQIAQLTGQLQQKILDTAK